MASDQQQSKSVSYKRAVINTAVAHLSTQRKLSPKKAHEWILQEVMAKRVNLTEVAEAILSDKAIAYRYSAPI